MVAPQALTITIGTQGGDFHTIETPSDIKVTDFVQELANVLQFPLTDSDGRPISWRIDDTDSGRTLANELSLEENNVRDGHRLVLLRSVTAGGGPEIPRTVKSPRVWEAVLIYKLIYSLAGLALGAACLLGGTVLFVRGLVGSTTWTAKLLGFESQVTDAAPGALLFVAGVFVVWATRFSPRAK
jgi:WXG100 protein secretion system (Wss), protein YukD